MRTGAICTITLSGSGTLRATHMPSSQRASLPQSPSITQAFVSIDASDWMRVSLGQLDAFRRHGTLRIGGILSATRDDQPRWDRTARELCPHLERDAIVAGDVAVGWTKDKVLMAWGAPYDKQKLVGREAVRSERLVYRFEVHEGGSMVVWESNSKTEYKAIRLVQRDLLLEDDVVVEIVKRDRWE